MAVPGEDFLGYDLRQDRIVHPLAPIAKGWAEGIYRARSTWGSIPRCGQGLAFPASPVCFAGRISCGSTAAPPGRPPRVDDFPGSAADQ